MQFATVDSLYLFLLLPLILLFFYYSDKTRQRQIARLGDPGLLAVLTDSMDTRKRRWKTGLWIVALCSLVLALSRPLWGFKLAVNAREGVEIITALDVSNSMLAEDFKPNRLIRAKLVIQDLMTQLAGNDIGLVLFSGSAFVQFPLTSDFNTALSFLDHASPATISRQGTALEEAITISQSAFSEKRAASRVILLLSDGENHTGDPLSAARQAAGQGIIIHCIGFGSPRGEPIPIRDRNGDLQGYLEDNGKTVLTRLDEEILKAIAFETGGSYILASPDGREISELVKKISAMETSESEEQFQVSGIERFAWFSGLAFFLLSVEWILTERKHAK